MKTLESSAERHLVSPGGGCSDEEELYHDSAARLQGGASN